MIILLLISCTTIRGEQFHEDSRQLVDEDQEDFAPYYDRRDRNDHRDRGMFEFFTDDEENVA